MKKFFNILQIYLLIILLSFCYDSIAATQKTKFMHQNQCAECVAGPVVAKSLMEQHIPLNYIGIAFHNPNYILPYYYTGSPDNAVYEDNTPNDESLNHGEFKFQFSVKVPLWKDIFNHPTSLYAAYTQLTYWQVYNKTTFIRENDYEPEFYLENRVKWHLFNDWYVNFFNTGLVHQSNGIGTDLQRSWNRFFVEAIASSEHWFFSIKPWYVLSKNDNNTDIAQYLGYGRFLVGFKCNQHVVSLQAHSLVEQSARRATGELTWSFPITHYIKGYVQGFSGYGQSLIEYNHRTNSVGVGLALSDWV